MYLTFFSQLRLIFFFHTHQFQNLQKFDLLPKSFLKIYFFRVFQGQEKKLIMFHPDFSKNNLRSLYRYSCSSFCLRVKTVSGFKPFFIRKFSGYSLSIMDLSSKSEVQLLWTLSTNTKKPPLRVIRYDSFNVLIGF